MVRGAFALCTTVVLAAALCESAWSAVKVTPAAQGYDIDIDSPTSASELVDAIAAATGVEVKGEPEDVSVGPNHLRNTTLERALRKLMPKAPFAVRFDSDDTPEEIIFLSPSQDGSGMGGSDGTDGSDGSDSTDPSDDAPADGSDSQDDSAPDGGG